jgi:hypothetical protein
MKSPIYFFAAIMLALSGSASAQAVPAKGGVCWAIAFPVPSPTTVFTCQHIGAVTVGQIYEKGYRVVSSMSHSSMNGAVSLIIEEQRP